MELKLLNENKLKIVLTNEDLMSMDLTCEEINNEDTGTRRMLWDILDKAKHQTGFDAAADKIFIQVYPDKSGGCLMYVTKMMPSAASPPIGSSAAPSAVPQENAPLKGDLGVYEKKYKSKLYAAARRKRSIYYFADSEVLSLACKQLAVCGYSGKSDIFADLERGGYYLYIEDTKEQGFSRICEYGDLVNNPFFSFALTEHAKKILADSAVLRFAEIYDSSL